MKQGFIFYKSFMDAIDTIPQIKYKYLLLESIIKLGLFSEESEEKLVSFCTEIEQKLSKNSQVLGLFFAIKPQLIANNQKYFNGCKGAKYGSLGGAPIGNQNAKKTTPKEKENEKEKEKGNVKENESGGKCNLTEQSELNPSGKKEKNKKEDIFFSPLKYVFTEEYEKVFNNRPYLSQFDLARLSELKEENENFEEIIPQALEKLKRIKFDPKLNFTPTASWLLKGNNFERVMNGEFEPQKTKMERLREELGLD